MNIKKHELNQTKAVDGVWREYDGGRFLIASSKGKAFTAFTAAEYRKLTAIEIRTKPELAIAIGHKALAEVCLKKWEGVDDDGTPIPCTPENKLALIETAPDFREWVSSVAGELGNYQAEAVAADAPALKSGGGVESPVGEG